ncbi:MAG: PspC domain-containing protein [Propionibacteriaceae bacterium]|jgi:phage shock protein PspC (stress-responsive transcriptional regulator)|nr:PspC domain-containing protein [Propionibacteriaceae bacterium]
MTNSPAMYRPRQGAVLGGVCLAIANRLGMDVGLVRILAVVLTFVSGGALILAYILGIIAIPRVPGQRRSAAGIAIVAVLLALVLAGYVSREDRWWLIPAAAVVVLVVVLARRPAPARPAEPTPFERSAQAWRDRLAVVRQAGATGDASAVYAPASTAVEVPVVEGKVVPRGWHGWLFALALAALFVGVLSAIQMAAGVVIPPEVWAAMVLLAFGVTLTIATWRGRPKFMILATLAAAIATVALAVPHDTVPNVVRAVSPTAATTISADPTTSLEDQEIIAGNTVFDYSEVVLEQDESVAIDYGTGSPVILLPAGYSYEVNWEVGAGAFEFAGEADIIRTDSDFSGSGSLKQVSGLGLEGTIGTTRFAPGTTEAAPKLTVNISLGAGNLEVAG